MAVNTVEFFAMPVHGERNKQLPLNEYVTLFFTYLGSFEGQYMTNKS